MAGPPSPAPVPPGAGPSIKPAMTVVAIALLIIVAGGALALAGTKSARPPATRGPVTSVPGSKIGAEAARAVLSHIMTGGEPPDDVVDALAVPAGSRYLGKDVESRGVSQFDSSVRLSVDEPEAGVRNFYLKLLSEEKWVESSLTAPAKGSTEIIAQRNGSDGYQWRVGITMRGVSALVAPALAGSGSSAAKTTLRIELYQVEDAS